LPSIAFNSEAEWLTLRDAHVGGSDVASLFNLWLFPDGSEKMLHAYEAPPEGALHLECVSPYKSSFRAMAGEGRQAGPDFGNRAHQRRQAP
jgi:hypothetical protein